MPTILLDALNALKIIRPPLSRKKVYKEIIEDFSDQSFADSLDSIDKLLKDESDISFKEAVKKAVQELKFIIDKADPKPAAFREL